MLVTTHNNIKLVYRSDVLRCVYFTCVVLGVCVFDRAVIYVVVLLLFCFFSSTVARIASARFSARFT